MDRKPKCVLLCIESKTGLDCVAKGVVAYSELRENWKINCHFASSI